VRIAEDWKIGILRSENELVNLAWRVEIDVPVEVSLAEVVQEDGDCGTGTQCWYVVAQLVHN
jgi:hypothetical protein